MRTVSRINPIAWPGNGDILGRIAVSQVAITNYVVAVLFTDGTVETQGNSAYGGDASTVYATELVTDANVESIMAQHGG